MSNYLPFLSNREQPSTFGAHPSQHITPLSNALNIQRNNVKSTMNQQQLIHLASLLQNQIPLAPAGLQGLPSHGGLPA